jgi:lysophospholipase L1-like esterase
MGAKTNDISLMLAKAVKQGFLPEIKDSEIDILSVEAKQLFGKDFAYGYNDSRNVYNLRAKHLRKTRAAVAKARAGTGIFRISTLGDSTVAGYNLTAPVTENWPNVLVKLLADNGAPTNGTGIVAAHNALSNDTRWNYPADWVGHAAWSSIRRNTTTTTPLLFTSNVAGTIARVYYSAGSNAFNLVIDGGAPLLVTPPGGTGIIYTEVTGLANTTHVLSIAKTVAGSTLYVFGAEVRSSATTGVILYNGGVSGIRIANIYQQALSHLNFALAESPSDLVIIRCETNDTQITSLANYKKGLQDTLTAVVASGADVVLVTAVPSLNKDFTEYTKVLYDIADDYDIPLIDHLDRLGTYAETNAQGFMSDDFHPTKTGYQEEAHSIFNALFR